MIWASLARSSQGDGNGGKVVVSRRELLKHVYETIQWHRVPQYGVRENVEGTVTILCAL
jgi:hypothetical protein